MTNPAPRSTEIVTARMSQAAIDAGLRQFMISVYNYMASGLALTGIVAYAAAETGLYASLIDTPMLFWGVTLAPLALVLLLSFRIEKMSLGTAKTAFWPMPPWSACLCPESSSSIPARALLELSSSPPRPSSP